MGRLAAASELCAVGVLAVLLPGASTLSPAQDLASRPEPPVIRVTTELVQVDAVVTNKQGRQITDLTAEDFEIVEDGKKRPITHFQRVSFEPPPLPVPTVPDATRLPPPTRETTKRTLAIVFDDLSLSFEGQVWARKALHRLVAERVGTGDLVSIVRTGGGIGNLQQFTNDKRLLDAAIEGVRFNPTGLGQLVAPTLSHPEAQGDSQERRNAAQSPEIRQLEQMMNELIGRADRERQVSFALGTLGTLGQVVRALGRMPGRKSLLLVSEGIAGAGGFSQDPRVRAQMRDLLDAAHRAAVVFYAIDPVGLRTYGGLFGSGFKEQLQHVGLNDLAEETGGLALLQSNDLDDAVTRIDEDRRGYYLIGYEPDEAHSLDRNGRPQFHRIKLELKRRARGLRVRSRRGFYARLDGPETALHATGFEDALFSPFPAVDVPVRLTPLFGHDAKGGSLVRCLLLIDAEEVSFTERPDGDLEIELDAGVVSIAASGRPAGRNTRAYSVRFTPEAAERSRRNGLLLTLDLPTEPGPHQVRAAVWDTRRNRGGSASEFLDVPDVGDGRLALSGVLMSGADTVTSPQSAGHGTAVDRDPNLTTAVRRFPAGTSVTYAFAVYNARRARATGDPRLKINFNLYHDGSRVAEMPADEAQVSAPSPEAPVTVGGALRLGSNLAPGDYTFAVTVFDAERGGKGSVALQFVTFEVTGP